MQALLKMIEGKSPGDRLPSVRWLIQSMQLSQATVVAALRTLEAKGLIDGRRGSGFYVAASGPAKVCILCDPRIIIRYGVSPYYSLLIASLFRKCSQAGLQASFHFTRTLSLETAHGSPEATFDPSLRAMIRSGAYNGAITLGLVGNQNHYLDQAGCLTAAHAGWGNLNVGFSIEDMLDDWLPALKSQGCRSICLVGARANDVGLFLKACGRLELEGKNSLDSNESHYIPRAFDSPTKSGFQEGLRVLSEQNMEDAYIFANDMLAQGFLMALSKHGNSSPAPLVATILVEGSHALAAWKDDVVSVPISPDRVAETLVRALSKRLKRRETPAPRAERSLYVSNAEGEKWVNRFGSLVEPSQSGTLVAGASRP
jgi:DNA-binding LacI/PurR family transcriptional regulator